MKTRTEKDSLGPKEVPAEALFGIQTLRAVENFPVSGWPMPRGFIRVPELYRGPFESAAITESLARLEFGGSIAAPGFMKPEGIVIFHTAGGVLFKKTIEGDDRPKGL